jgi:hypothetical protein
MNRPAPVIAGLAASSLVRIDPGAIAGVTDALVHWLCACGSEGSEWIGRSFLLQSGRQ